MLEIAMWVVAVAAVVGTWANTQQKIWCFPVWAVTNACMAAYSIHRVAYPTAGLLAVYFCLALYGWRSWHKKGAQDGA